MNSTSIKGLCSKFDWLNVMSPDVNISSAVKMRLFSLWLFADTNGYCWPNQSDIESRIGCKSIGRTSEYLKKAEELGYVIIGRLKGKGNYESCNYQLSLPTLVGTNKPSTLSTSKDNALNRALLIKSNGLLAPPNGGVTTAYSYGLLAPPDGGASVSSDLLVPTPVGVPASLEDFIVDGRDVRDAPSWAEDRFPGYPKVVPYLDRL